MGMGPGPMVAVNISGQSIEQEAFRNELADILATTALRRERLIFELTDTARVERQSEVATFLRWMRRRGHAVCLDDFGSDAAAYSYLRQFEVDYVKIDGLFLRAAMADANERALIGSVVSLCAELKCRTIATMIETSEQAEAAAQLGIGFGQGWLFGDPARKLPQSVRT
jgi:EAL domain-containing protein (putative c-di-GMP-specific phosphodiesterase class I)